MGKYIVGVFFALVCMILIVTFYNSTVADTKTFGGKADTQIDNLNTITPVTIP